MSKFVGIIAGGLEIAAGVVLALTGVGAAFAPYLIAAGAGQIISGIGTILSSGPVNGFATAVRNPTAPWKVVYGRVRTGGTVVYINTWGDNRKMLDMVIVLAAHPCQSVDVLLFDQQRIQIDTSAAPAGAAAGSGTSFTPVQQTVFITDIQRTDGVVTVSLNANIPYLIESDHVQITDITGDLTLNGVVQVAQILSRVVGAPGSIRFTYLSGGANSHVTNQGHVHTQWADYGRKVYFEPLLGNQPLGLTFQGMQATPYDGDKNKYVSPDHQQALGSPDAEDVPNPWYVNPSHVSNYSLQGKTAVFLRLHYDSEFFKGGIPQISFLLRGKNDILDPRTSPPTHGYTENAALCIADFLSNQTWGFKAAYGTEIPYANLIAAANVCDEQVPLALSTVSPPITEPAYTCNGQFDLTMKRGEILQNLLTSCAGRITYTGGQFVIWPAAWTGNSFAIGSNPGGGVVSLPDFAQIAAGPIRWRPTVSIRDLYNGVKGTYISQANKWMASDFPPYCQDAIHGYSSDLNLAADGGDRRWLDIQLPFTISASMAQRIAKIELLRRRHQGTGTLILNMTGYQIAPLDLLLATIPYLDWSGKQLEVLATRFRLEEGSGEPGAGPALLIEIDVQETASSIYDWSTSEELSPQGYVQPAIPGIGSFGFFATELVPGFNAPFPWLPGYVGALVGDAFFPGPVLGSPPENKAKATFGMQVGYGIDAQGNATANLNIKGALPPNALSSINPPQITCTPGTAGRLPPGTYVITASAVDTGSPVRNSKLSVPIQITILPSSPPSGNNGSIVVEVSWPGGSNGGEIYVADGTRAAGYHFQAHLNSDQETLTITDFDQSSVGSPDSTCDHLAVAWQKVIHSGTFAAQVQAVTADTITLGGADMTLNQWAGHVISLLGKLDSTEDLIILNMPVESSTASTGASPGPAEFTLTIGPNSNGDHLPDLTTQLVVGDLLVMRFKATFTATSFSDPNIANSFYPDGATGIEEGHVAMVLTGPDAGDVQTIASVSLDGGGKKTIINLASAWRVQPNDGDLVIVVEAGWGPESLTQSFSSAGRGAVNGVAASPLVANLGGQTWVFIVRTQTRDDIDGLDMFAPVREIFVFGSQGTRTIAESQTMLFTDRIIDADASAGPVDYTMLPFVEIPNQSLFAQKIDASPNPVQILCQAGDTINGFPSVLLSKQWDWIVVTVSGNG